AFVRRRSGHDKAKPLSGRISALAGRQGRLRACTQNLQRRYSQPLRNLVTTSIIKSDGVPGRRPGGLRFSVVGPGSGVAVVHGLPF
ncbi:hypothetical protein EGK68_24245, partial [Enterobacter cloacae]